MGLTRSYLGTIKAGKFPKKILDIAVADTDDITIGVN